MAHLRTPCGRKAPRKGGRARNKWRGPYPGNRPAAQPSWPASRQRAVRRVGDTAGVGPTRRISGRGARLCRSAVAVHSWRLEVRCAMKMSGEGLATVGNGAVGRREKTIRRCKAWRLWASGTAIRTSLAVERGGPSAPAPQAGPKSKRRWAGLRTQRVIHAVHGRVSIHPWPRDCRACRCH